VNIITVGCWASQPKRFANKRPDKKQVATAMAARSRILATTPSILLYSPGDANTVHHIHGFFNQRESAPQTASGSVYPFLQAHVTDKRETRKRQDMRKNEPRPCYAGKAAL